MNEKKAFAPAALHLRYMTIKDVKNKVNDRTDCRSHYSKRRCVRYIRCKEGIYLRSK